jgi:hypothetical protein
MSRSIKMEEEDYPLSSPDYDHAFFNHCLTTFYDQDSDEIIQAKCSAQDVPDFPFRCLIFWSTRLTSATLLSLT